MRFISLLLAASVLAATQAFQASADLEELTVHIVPHTHDDVGWLKTIDQYFVGSKSNIQSARVQYILDSVIDALLKSPDRKFIYVEMAFFTRWWQQQDQQRKETVRQLVNNGQLEFINAGWCMNDEAATYYQSIIDQMTLGHLFLKKEFNFIPRVGWHIDPFGHSSTQASLFSSMGFDSFMFGRIDYQDKNKRVAEKNMEIIWRGSPSLGESNDMFSAALYWGYGPPPGFCFDVHCDDDPIQGRKDLFDYDLDKHADAFAAFCREQSNAIRGDIMMTFGSDFTYEQAEEWFSNIDLLIGYFKENYDKYKIVLKYSTPAIYTDAKFASNVTWNLKTDDFFPYADKSHAYWTGYFVSRAAYKAYERYSNAYLQACRQLEFVRDLHLNSSSTSSSYTLAEFMGIAQHHDSVTGTAKQHVNDDYTKRLAMGCAECDLVASEAFSFLFTGKLGTQFDRCEYINISICSASESFEDKLSVVVYNSLGQTRNEAVRIPVSSSNIAVVDSHGQPVAFQVQPLSSDISQARYRVNIPSKATHEVVFEAKVPALSAVHYSLVKTRASSFVITSFDATPAVLENDYLQVVFPPETGLIDSLIKKQSGKSTKLAQSWEWYRSSTGTPDDRQPSGAYIFRPVDSNTTSLGAGSKFSVVRGNVADEVHQSISPIITQTVRLYHSKPYVEFEYTLGPIDVSDHIGKEVITRFTSSLDSGDIFFTDANGRELLERKLNYRKYWPLEVHEPVSGNYYPVNTRILIQDSKQDLQLTVVTDRSQGGTSLKSGQLELMVNRRTVRDDNRGVGEALDEDIVVRGKYWLFFDDIEKSTELHRMFAERLQHPFAVFFTKSAISPKNDFALALNGIPSNLHVITVQKLEQEGLLLLRLGHLFAEGESKKYSVPVDVDLSHVFGVELVEELSLSANQPIGKVRRLSWNNIDRNPSSSVLHGSTVRIAPMEIRTYVVKLMK